ncbi:MAG: FAD-dependent oxidoreductase [SAR202 cluster bacterium]|nr:FAD-dependent oxidoreductase [SAR202 cluster bacterium]
MEQPKITVYGAPWCPDCRQSKQFLGEQRVRFNWVDIDEDEEGRKRVQELNDGKQIIPTIIFEDGSILAEPSNAELAAKLGISPKAKREFYDLIIVGSGPAGLTTALYAAREGIETLVIEKGGIGGQAGVTERIDNYPGFVDGIGGSELADQMRAHAERFGVEILPAQTVTGIQADGDHKMITTESGDEYCSSAILLAPGTRYRMLNVPGENDLIGAGIHFCATCDGPFYKDKEVIVVGGGNSGIEEGLFLTKFVSKVTVLEFTDKLAASQILREKAENHPKMEIRLNSAVQEFKGSGHLESVLVLDRTTDKVEELFPSGAFIFIGLDPNTGFVKETVETDKYGFITTSGTMETSLEGVFAAGDARGGSTKQVASAVGEGATAALMIRNYLEKQQGNRGYKGD